jgi:3-hydroxymyristoyl/3-hydroxydecanoyl-(acyl carrier protein) dehydratase
MTRLPLEIAVDHPAFPGHFPSRPIVPGVVLLDGSLRAIIAGRAIAAPIRIASAKFLSMVGPGEPTRLEFESTGDGDSVRLFVYAGLASDERLAMTGVVGFATAGAD